MLQTCSLDWLLHICLNASFGNFVVRVHQNSIAKMMEFSILITCLPFNVLVMQREVTFSSLLVLSFTDLKTRLNVTGSFSARFSLHILSRASEQLNPTIITSYYRRLVGQGVRDLMGEGTGERV